MAIAVLFTIIPLYFPSIRFLPKKVYEYSSSYNSIEDSIIPTPPTDSRSQNHFQQKDSEPCSHGDDNSQACHGDDDLLAPKISKGDVKKPSNSSEREFLDPKEPQVYVERSRNPMEGDLPIEKTPEKGVQVISSPSQRDMVASERSENGRKKPRRPRDNDVVTPKVPEKNVMRQPSDSVASKVSESDENCDIFSGEWVPNPEGPYYTNLTCLAIQEHQNCMKFGRPDKGFMKWRWKPDGCELPVFDPYQFLELVRGKSMAFVGDSVARNHMQSLICLLSMVVYPVDVSNTTDQNFRRWEYISYNFTISIFWSPYLVRTQQTDPNDETRPFNLYLDEFNEDWTPKIEGFDYVIISAGQWFFRPSMFYVKRSLVGCLYCLQSNVTQMTAYYSYRMAFRTAFRAINSLKNYRGITFLRTFAPSHFENGPWDKGGDCARTRPFRRDEAVLDGANLDISSIQMKELEIAQIEGTKRGLRFRLLDTTQAMLLRPDGHPNKYGHWPFENKTNDCVHWCLPGPIDTWNDFLLEMMKREVRNQTK
ncbi:unnamed protein product [Ilex paraguariensis]|uniref:Trichome birefringence-like N-terminal domain-containing protein n=1 Tax=Ilex paraguariensis TaxID=185542 RepID=A0ABC8RR02_9AQUA